MGIISWIVFGLIAGTVAKMVHPGRDPGGCIMTSLLGIGGALLGGYIGTWLGWGKVSGFSLGSLAIAVLGSLIILIAYRMLFGKPR